VGVVLDQYIAITKLVQLLGIEVRVAVSRVAMGIEELGRTYDPHVDLAYLEDLTLPSSAETGQDLVLAREHPSGLEIKLVDSTSL
jgi:hypothetical protein